MNPIIVALGLDSPKEALDLVRRIGDKVDFYKFGSAEIDGIAADLESDALPDPEFPLLRVSCWARAVDAHTTSAARPVKARL